MNSELKMGSIVFGCLIVTLFILENFFNLNRHLTNPIIGIGMGIWLFLTGFVKLNHKRLIQNIPTSKISSMAMGLVEIQGRVLPLGPQPIIAPYSRTECVFYHYQIQQFVQDANGYTGWKTIAENSSNLPFYVDDDSGKVLVDAKSAEIRLSPRYLSSRADAKVPLPTILASGTMKYVESFIIPKESVYILGTAKNTKIYVDPKQEVAKKVTGWYYDAERKKDFDANQDGEIDKQEYETMKQKAEESFYKKSEQDTTGLSDIMITRGDNNSLFVISNGSEKEIVSKIGTKVILYIFGGALVTIIAILYLGLVLACPRSSCVPCY